MKVFKRDGRYFKINEQVIKPEARKPNVINGLYAAVYEEFKGASEKKPYAQLGNKERFEKLNEFARNWLQTKGFYNGTV